MMTSLRHLALPLTFGLLLVTGAVFGRGAQSGGFEVRHVAGQISYIGGGPGGNIGVLVGDKGMLLVDDQLARFRDEIELARIKVSGEPVRYVINTHWHGDHTGNNIVYKDSTIIAHDNVRRRLAADPQTEGRKAEDTPLAALPDVTFERTLTLYWGGEEMRLVHYPAGHTDGDSVVFFVNSNVVHMGDLFFSGAFPFIDLDSGGSVEGYVAAVGDVLARIGAGDPKIIPGHGVLSNREGLRAFHDMLVETAARVREALAEGQSSDDMKAGGLVDDYAPVWGNAFIDKDRYIDILATSLAR